MVRMSVAWKWARPNMSSRSRLAQSRERLPARPTRCASAEVSQMVPAGGGVPGEGVGEDRCGGADDGEPPSDLVGVGAVCAGCGVEADGDLLGSVGGAHWVVSFRADVWHRAGTVPTLPKVTVP